MAEVPHLQDRLDATLAAYVAAVLERKPPPQPQRIQREVDRAQSQATWEAVFGLSPAAAASALIKSNPQHLSLVMQGAGPAHDLYAVAFDIGYGNVFSTRVHGFAPGPQGYRPTGPASIVDGAISGGIRLRSSGPRVMRFIVWCLHIGSPEGLTTVAVYKFDGKELRTLWLRQEVPAARVTLQGGLVVIESNLPESANEATIFHYERKFYRQVPAGLERARVEGWTER